MTHYAGDPTPKPDLPAPPADLSADAALSSMYRLGDDTRNREALAGGKRVLSWRLRDADVELAPLAGWDLFPFESEAGIGRLYLPSNTRSAYSILTGTEAWAGEKSGVVERVTKYLRDIHARFGIYDTGFSWNQVGITVGAKPEEQPEAPEEPEQQRHIFIAPPNTPSPGVPQQQAETWQSMVVEELGILLQSDTVNAGLIESFTQSLQQRG